MEWDVKQAADSLLPAFARRKTRFTLRVFITASNIHVLGNDKIVFSQASLMLCKCMLQMFQLFTELKALKKQYLANFYLVGGRNL